MLNTPILFIIFNRPETTKLVFETIRRAEPKKLFIVADGPRMNYQGEFEKCQEARSVVSNINWECEVQYLYRETNWGCGKSVSDGITWFFNQVEEGIILEDDCLPEETFFRFCEQMLEKYRAEPKVQIITGTNYLFGKGSAETDYYFSNIIAIWGWATWKRTWQSYSKEIKNYDRELFFKLYPKDFANYLASMLDAAISKKIDTWDIQFSYTIIKTGGLAVVPTNNLINNIGYIGTHSTEKSKFQDMETAGFPTSSIKHPQSIEANSKNDKIAIKNMIEGEKLRTTIIRKMKESIKRLYGKVGN